MPTKTTQRERNENAAILVSTACPSLQTAGTKVEARGLSCQVCLHNANKDVCRQLRMSPTAHMSLSRKLSFAGSGMLPQHGGRKLRAVHLTSAGGRGKDTGAGRCHCLNPVLSNYQHREKQRAGRCTRIAGCWARWRKPMRRAGEIRAACLDPGEARLGQVPRARPELALLHLGGDVLQGPCVRRKPPRHGAAPRKQNARTVSATERTKAGDRWVGGCNGVLRSKEPHRTSTDASEPSHDDELWISSASTRRARLDFRLQNKKHSGHVLVYAIP